MLENEAYIGKKSPEVVFDLLKTYNPVIFAFKSHMPKTGRTEDRWHTFLFRDVPNIETFLDKILELSTKDERKLISFFSQVHFDDDSKHFPMMDFSYTRIKEYGTDRVKEIMKSLGQKNGVILNSGRCYHYYGFEPMSQTEWLNMIHKSSVFDEIGPYYPKFQFMDGGCLLRLSANAAKPKLPEVIDTLSI